MRGRSIRKKLCATRSRPRMGFKTCATSSLLTSNREVFRPKCCQPFPSDWPTIFPGRFIPAPVVYQYGNCGIEAVEPVEYFSNPKKYEFASLSRRLLLKKLPEQPNKTEKHFPFDSYCPSMEEKLMKGVCKMCGHYWPSEAAMKRHKVIHRNSKKDNSDDEGVCEIEINRLCERESESSELETEVDDDKMPVFTNIFEILKSPFIEDI